MSLLIAIFGIVIIMSVIAVVINHTCNNLPDVPTVKEIKKEVAKEVKNNEEENARWSKEAILAECEERNAMKDERLAKALEEWNKHDAKHFNKKVVISSDGFLKFGDNYRDKAQDIPIKFIEGITITEVGHVHPPTWLEAYPSSMFYYSNGKGASYMLNGGYIINPDDSVVTVHMTSGRTISEYIDARQGELYLDALRKAWRRALGAYKLVPSTTTPARIHYS